MDINIWIPVLTLVIGFCLNSAYGILTESRRARTDAQRRRVEFQRKTLSETQVLVSDHMRKLTQAFISDQRNAASGHDWGTQFLPDGLSDNLAAEARHLKILASRIGKVEIQERVVQFVLLGASVTAQKNEAVAQDELSKAVDVATNLIQEIGLELQTSV